MLSDEFSEGRIRKINGSFPSDSCPYTEDYGYLSDSDLEDDDDSEVEQSPRNSGSRNHQIEVPEAPPQLPQNADETEGGRQSALDFTDPSDIRAKLRCGPANASLRMGKVAIIHDMAAVTYATPLLIEVTVA